MASLRYHRYSLIAVLILLALFPDGPALGAPLDAVYPQDGAVDVSAGKLSLIWEEASADLTYRVQFGDGADTMKGLKLADPSLCMADVTVELSTAYYWQVSAVNASDDVEIKSRIYSFRTVDAEAPTVTGVYPADKEKDVPFGKVTLHWNTDTPGLLFDVWLGEDAASMRRVASNLSRTLCDMPLASSKKYHWQIEARDGAGGAYRSPLWTFYTACDDSISGGCSLTGRAGALLLLPLALLFRR